METEEAERKVHEWNEEVKTDPKFNGQCNKFIEMMSTFGSVWEGHLGCISAAKHGIKLTSN